MDIGQVFLCSEPSRVTAIITEIESCLTRAKKEARAWLISLIFCISLGCSMFKPAIHEHYEGQSE